MTATFIGVGIARRRSSATLASGMRSMSARPHDGHCHVAAAGVDAPLRLFPPAAGRAVADRAVVHADADGRALVLRAPGDLAHAVLVVDVARIEAQLVDLRVERHEREPVVEVDIGDDREDAAADDLLERLAGALIRHGNASDLAADLLQALDLADRGVDVVRERRAHRLHRDRRAVADGRSADPHALRLPPGTRTDAVLRQIQIDAHRAHSIKCTVERPSRTRDFLTRWRPYSS